MQALRAVAADYAVVVPSPQRFDLAFAIEDSLSREGWVSEWLSYALEELLGGCNSLDLQIAVLRGDEGALQGDGVISFDSRWPTSAPAVELARRVAFDGQGSGVHEPLRALALLATRSSSFVRERSQLALVSLGRADDASLDAPETLAQRILSAAGEGPGRLISLSATEGPSPRLDAFARALREGGAEATSEPLDWVVSPLQPLESYCQVALTACAPELLGDDGAPIADGQHVRCILTETLPDDAPCGLARFERPSSGDRTVCQLCQEADGSAPFEVDVRDEDVTACASQPAAWRYRVEGGCPRFELMPEARLTEGAVLRSECLVRLFEE